MDAASGKDQGMETMPTITFIHPDGRREDLDIAEGMSIMQGATLHGISGIVAECGGSAMCATCHIYVAPGDMHRLPPMSSDEDALLDGTACERLENSRLSCQIEVTPLLDGVIVRLPEAQY